MKPAALMLAALLFTTSATIAQQRQAYPPGNGVSDYLLEAL